MCANTWYGREQNPAWIIAFLPLQTKTKMRTKTREISSRESASKEQPHLDGREIT
jgi:hypothetical protein